MDSRGIPIVVSANRYDTTPRRSHPNTPMRYNVPSSPFILRIKKEQSLLDAYDSFAENCFLSHYNHSMLDDDIRYNIRDIFKSEVYERASSTPKRLRSDLFVEEEEDEPPCENAKKPKTENTTFELSSSPNEVMTPLGEDMSDELDLMMNNATNKQSFIPTHHDSIPTHTHIIPDLTLEDKTTNQTADTPKQPDPKPKPVNTPVIQDLTFDSDLSLEEAIISDSVEDPDLRPKTCIVPSVEPKLPVNQDKDLNNAWTSKPKTTRSRGPKSTETPDEHNTKKIQSKADLNEESTVDVVIQSVFDSDLQLIVDTAAQAEIEAKKTINTPEETSTKAYITEPTPVEAHAAYDTTKQTVVESQTTIETAVQPKQDTVEEMIVGTAATPEVDVPANQTLDEIMKVKSNPVVQPKTSAAIKLAPRRVTRSKIKDKAQDLVFVALDSNFRDRGRKKSNKKRTDAVAPEPKNKSKDERKDTLKDELKDKLQVETKDEIKDELEDELQAKTKKDIKDKSKYEMELEKEAEMEMEVETTTESKVELQVEMEAEIQAEKEVKPKIELDVKPKAEIKESKSSSVAELDRRKIKENKKWEIIHREKSEYEIRKILESFPTLAESYELIEKAGSGTFSKVYKAKDLLGDQYVPLEQQNRIRSILGGPKTNYVAIKLILDISTPNRIANEIECLMALRSSPCVTPLITAFRNNASVFVVLPYIEFDHFDDFYSKMKMEDIKCYISELLTGLQSAHEKGIMHRDVKPGNFLYNRKGKFGFLADFGLAQISNPHFDLQEPPSSSQSGTEYTKHNGKPGFYNYDSRPSIKADRSGTRGYRAPEVLLRFRHQTTSVDIWAVGVILLNILSGKYPFFEPEDDADGIMEIGHVFGMTKLKEFMDYYGRRFLTNIPTIPEQEIDFVTLFKEINKEQVEKWDREEFLMAIDLMKSCLHLIHTKRPSATEALKHPFLKNKY